MTTHHTVLHSQWRHTQLFRPSYKRPPPTDRERAADVLKKIKKKASCTYPIEGPRNQRQILFWLGSFYFLFLFSYSLLLLLFLLPSLESFTCCPTWQTSRFQLYSHFLAGYTNQLTSQRSARCTSTFVLLFFLVLVGYFFIWFLSPHHHRLQIEIYSESTPTPFCRIFQRIITSEYYRHIRLWSWVY